MTALSYRQIAERTEVQSTSVLFLIDSIGHTAGRENPGTDMDHQRIYESRISARQKIRIYKREETGKTGCALKERRSTMKVARAEGIVCKKKQKETAVL